MSGVHYPDDTGRELHAVYHLLSITHNRRVRLEVTAPDADPHIPSLVGVYPTNDWHERETYDLFGIVFDGHPALTRIQMPDDWKGHPQRKDYPLGGIPVEYQRRRDPAARTSGGRTMTHDDRTQQAVRDRRRDRPRASVFTVTGGDWDDDRRRPSDDSMHDERIVVNMGPQHPSTHGVLRLILELEGETVTECRPAIGYLHTGIEKNMEYRTWTQGVTFVHPDGLPGAAVQRGRVLPRRWSGCSASRTTIPERATGHPGADDGAQPDLLAPGLASPPIGLELGAISTMLLRLPRARDTCLDLFELITGLRMNHAYIRPGGVAQDLPPGALEKIRELPATRCRRSSMHDVRTLLDASPIWHRPARRASRYLDLTGCMALGVTGPVLRSTGLRLGPAQDPAVLRLRDLRVRRADWRHLRRLRPVPGPDGRDARVAEDHRAVRSTGCSARRPRPVMIGRQEDRLAGPARRSAPTAWATRPSTSRRSWASRWRRSSTTSSWSPRASGCRPGRSTSAIESPRGELGAHVVSDGGTRPYRVHFRDPSFTNLQAIAGDVPRAAWSPTSSPAVA